MPLDLLTVEYFNPRPPWGGRHRKKTDFFNPIKFQSTPSVGRATQKKRSTSDLKTFQSTPSVGRATFEVVELPETERHFNPRPPWGGRHQEQSTKHKQEGISIHALRGEGDSRIFLSTPSYCYFNPRPPWGGRQIQKPKKQAKKINFNPRPPWGGRPRLCLPFGGLFYFNPRPPWGGRQFKDNSEEYKELFQSTPSVGRATVFCL